MWDSWRLRRALRLRTGSETVYRIYDPVEAELIAGWLRERGDEAGVAIDMLGDTAVPEAARVVVPAAQADEVKRLLADSDFR